MKGSSKSLLVTVVVSLLLAVAASLSIFFYTFSKTSYPTLVAIKRTANPATTGAEVFAYVSSRNHIKSENNKEKHISSSLTASTIEVTEGTKPDEVDKLSFVPKPDNPFISSELPEFKIKYTWVILTPALQKEDTVLPYEAGDLEVKQAVVLVSNDKYPLQQLALDIYNHFEAHPDQAQKKEVDPDMKKKIKEDYDANTKKRFVRYYTLNCPITLKKEKPEEVFIKTKAEKGTDPDFTGPKRMVKDSSGQGIYLIMSSAEKRYLMSEIKRYVA